MPHAGQSPRNRRKVRRRLPFFSLQERDGEEGGAGLADSGDMTGASTDRTSGVARSLRRHQVARRLGTPNGRPAATTTAPRPNRPMSDDGKIASAVRETGHMCATAFEALRQAPLKGVPVSEFFDQCWFLARVTTLPLILLSIPFGMVIALEVGSLLQQIGAQSQLGAAMVLAVVREQAPVATALLIAGAGGSAMCADLGSRRIRDEISAMEVMGVNALHRLVLPRLLAATLVAVLLDAVVSVAGIAGGLWFGIHSIHITASSFFATFSELSQMADLVIALVKAGIFGFIAAMVACYKGLYCKSGPKGVGDAVNQAVVVTFILSFFVNFLLTVFYFNFIPQKGL
jgi:phospholipid/cholesterol/gamma-HCH transport system permease protein